MSDLFGNHIAGFPTRRLKYQRLKPARISFSTSLVCVAENNPVLLCFGRYLKIVLMLASNPMSRSRSASSNTRMSSSFTPLARADIMPPCLCSNKASSRPGVPTIIFPEIKHKCSSTRISESQISRRMRKPTIWEYDQVQHKPGHAVTE